MDEKAIRIGDGGAAAVKGYPPCATEGSLQGSMAMGITSLKSALTQTSLAPPTLEADSHRKTLQDSSWADGLRGVAAIFVMCSHLTLCFARYIVAPNHGQGQGSAWMQRPIFRLVGQGPAWVACFFILSGFVNALKPIKLARGGNTETALSNLAVSSFRRSFRLFLPATTATIIGWFIAQFGANETARLSNAYWMFSTAPVKSATWPDAIWDLLRAIRTTWCYFPNNPYDQPQWALLYLLQGSMFVFTALVVTINLTPLFRTATLSLLYVWSTNWGIHLADPLCGMSVFSGVILAEFNHSEYPLMLCEYSPIFAPPLVFISLILMSFPADFQAQAPWSRFLLNLHHKIAPESADVARFWPVVGAQVLVATIMCTPHLRRALSHKTLLWLGKISFPLYLLHGTFIRTVLAWLLFANQSLVQIRDDDGQINMRYPLPGYGTFLVVMPVFLLILFWCTHVWAVKVEPWFGIITKEAETLMFGKKDRPLPLPVRQD